MTETVVNWASNVVFEAREVQRPATVEALAELVQRAHRDGRHIRAAGSAWSFTDSMATTDTLVRLDNLAAVLALAQGPRLFGHHPAAPPVLASALSPATHAQGLRLAHVEAGITIRALYEALDPRPRVAGDPLRPRLPGDDERPMWALMTMGGASGQTLAGAVSTSTHGGDFDAPPIADHVKAIHLIAPDGQQHWIERAGAGAITDRAALERALDGRIAPDNIHYDDAWFQAVLVSMGAMGILYALVVEVRDQFGLHEDVQPTTWRAIRPLLESGELFTGATWIDRHPRTLAPTGTGPAVAITPIARGLSVFINPYRVSDDYATDAAPDRQVVLVTHAMSTEGADGPLAPRPGLNDLFVAALLALFEQTSSTGVVSGIVNTVIGGLRDVAGTPGYPVSWSVLDTTSGAPPPILSLEIVVSTAAGLHVRYLDRILAIFDDLIARQERPGVTKFAGGINLRYTRPSSALLGMQYAEPGSDERFCHIEIIVLKEVDFLATVREGHTSMENYSEDFIRRFEEAMPEFSARLHWGQYSILDRRDPQQYPGFQRWRTVRNQLTAGGTIRTFDNDFTVRHGLSVGQGVGWSRLGGLLPARATGAPDGRPRETVTAPITVLRDGAGCLELFVIGGDGQLCWTRQAAPNNDYLGWQVLPSAGELTGRVAAANHLADATIAPHLFALGRDGVVYKGHRDGDAAATWSWGAFGGPGFVGAPVVAYDIRKQMHVFALHGDGRVLRRNQYHSLGWGWGDHWGELPRSPVPLVGELAAIRNGDGAMEVIARTATGQIWRTALASPIETQPGPEHWTAWARLGTLEGAGDPIAFARSDAAVEIVARGGDGGLWRFAGRGDWTRIGALLVMPNTRADVVVSDGLLQLVVLDAGGAIVRLAEGLGGWELESLGGHVASDPLLNASLVDSPIGPPAIGENVGGRLEVFAKAAPDQVAHRWQHAPRTRLGGPGVLGTPALASSGAGRLALAVRGGDRGLWLRGFDGAWSARWEALGGVLTSAPALASWGAERLDVVALALDHSLVHRWRGVAGWSDWDNLGGIGTSAPAVASWGAGRLDVFVRGTDLALWHRGFDGRWSAWESLGGVLTSAPAAASWGPNHLDVVVLGRDHAVYRRRFLDGWRDWERITIAARADLANPTSAPAAVARAADRIELFVRGANHAVWHKPSDSSGADWPWTSLGGHYPIAPSVDGQALGTRPGVVASAPAAASGADRVDLVALDDGGALRHTWQDADGWQDWVTLTAID